MTGDLIIDSVISLGAIALMVLLARLFFPASPVEVTKSAAGHRLAFDEPDFAPAAWLVDGHGRAALAEGDAGDIALVVRLGADLVTRRFGVAVPATAENGVLTIPQMEPGVGKVVIAAGDQDAALWARKLTRASDIKA